MITEHDKGADKALRSMESWLKGIYKSAKRDLEAAKREDSAMGHFEDCGNFYREAVVKAEARCDTIRTIIISTQKYRKKLKHTALRRTELHNQVSKEE